MKVRKLKWAGLASPNIQKRELLQSLGRTEAMSWKDVFKDLSEMEGIVQDMEEETLEDDQPRQEIKSSERPKPKLMSQKSFTDGADVKSKLLTEILEFHDKKLQLRKIRKEDEPSPGLPESKTIEEIVSLEDNSERSKRRGSSVSSGILRRPSIGVEPSSPAASADRLSVTFAEDHLVVEDETKPSKDVLGLRRTISTAIGLKNGSVTSEIDHKTYVSFDSPEPDLAAPDLPSDDSHDEADGDGEQIVDDFNEDLIVEEEAEDEYSSGIREIVEMQNLDVRRGSSGGSRRRMSAYSALGSRPISRHSQNSGKSESIYENLKLHKEVIEQVKYQLWPLDRKIRTVRQAKLFVSQHEKEMESQLKSEKSFWSYAKQGRLKTVQVCLLIWRWLREHLDYLVPWQGRIKRIESQFGSVVSSYFVFLRWVVYVNIVITVVITSFIILPEFLSGYWAEAGVRKVMLPIEEKTATNLKVLWDFEGVLRYSPMFYGWYGNQQRSKSGYETPLAYFVVMMIVYIFSFVVILRKMQSNAKQSKLSEKADEATFTWKVFVSWDYGIANVEAAHNKVSAIVMGLREAIIEEAEKEKEQQQDWKTIGKRGSAQALFVLSLACTAFGVVFVVQRSTQPEAERSFYRQNEVTIVMSLIGALLPKFFGLLELLEGFHPRKAMQFMLARIMILNLLSLYSLIFALIGKTTNMVEELHHFKMLNDSSLISGQSTVLAMAESLECFPIPIPCHVLDKLDDNNQQFGLRYKFDKDVPLKGDAKEVYSVRVKDSMLEEEYRRQLEGNNTLLLDTMVLNISDTLIQKDKSARLRMLWEELTFSSLENGTRSKFGDCTQEECKIECDLKCSHLCEIFFSCAEGRAEDLVADFETRRLRELTQSLTAVINVLESAPLIITTGQKDLLDCMQCFSFKFLTNEMVENDTVQDIFVNMTREGQLASLAEDRSGDGLIPQEERTCQKEICRKIWEEKYVPKDEVPGYKEDCKSAADNYIKGLEKKIKLRKLCWETMFGQELVKLTVMDMVFSFLQIILGDLMRSLMLRIFNYCWFWDLERTFPGYPQFDVAENILHTVNNQGMIWMGLFMAPGLPILNLVKLVMMFHLKSWAVLVTNVPHETVFKASENGNFYLLLLLMMLFLCILPVAFTLVRLKPSWHCGPFSDFNKIYLVSTTRFLEILPESLHSTLDYITSPGIIIPTLLLLILMICYLYSLTNMLRESTEDLKAQLYHERTEGRRKLMADRKNGKEEKERSLSQRWKDLLPHISATNSSQGRSENPASDSEPVQIQWTSKEQQILRKIQTLERPSVSSVNPTSLRMLTPSPIKDNPDGEEEEEEEEDDQCSSTDNKDVTELEDDTLESVFGNVERGGGSAPKIWISKSASMEHDLN